MIKCEVKLQFDIGYCIDDFETKKEWEEFCENSKHNEEFLLDIINGDNRAGCNFEITEVTGWEAEED